MTKITIERETLERGIEAMKDGMSAHLEEISDKIRSGEPVGLMDALAAIDYQERLRAEREALRSKTFIGRLRLWFRRMTTTPTAGRME
jgi:hypothetical protein